MPSDRGSAMDKVRTWNLSSNGETDAMEFIEELCESYELPPVMLELVTDQALMWYCNNRRTWDCQGFKESFSKFF